MFRNEDIKEEKITVLGITFNTEEERRNYFREELRKKLPELKQMEGFPIGEDEDILKLSDPPYYTACPNPWLNDFIEEWEEEKMELVEQGKRNPDFEVTEPYAADISEGKNNPIYMAHSYHTKVPHPAIMRYIMHYTQPGDILFDGFAGTGMTGVAASFCESPDNDFINLIKKEKQEAAWGKRNAICIDLSPIASFISYSLNNVFQESSKFKKKLELLKNKHSWMFRTKHNGNEYGEIIYTVWNEIILCQHCDHEHEFIDMFVNFDDGVILNEARCQNCNGAIERRKVIRKSHTKLDSVSGDVIRELQTVPYRICYTYKGKRHFKKPDQEDIDLIKKINRQEVENFVPLDSLPKGDKMNDPVNKYITKVYQLYNYRTLLVLSDLWAESSLEEKFYITNSISRNLTKLNRFIVNKHNPNGRINGPLSGTLYVPSEVVEQNPFDIISYKLFDSHEKLSSQSISCQSTTQISSIESKTIDYIFVDPPFGANIMYSELNFITEAWLKVKTNNTQEAIENKTQNKSKLEYQGLMLKAFKEFFRILKPGKWMTVEFSNTSAAIWNCIQISLTSSGFIIANISALDKIHGGIKSMRYSTSVKQDLIISCYKPSSEFDNKFQRNPHSNVAIWDFIEEHLNHLPIHLMVENSTTAIIERSPKILFDRLIAFYVQRTLPVPIDAGEFQQGLRERFIERDGMFFTNEQVQEYDKKRKRILNLYRCLFLYHQNKME